MAEMNFSKSVQTKDYPIKKGDWVKVNPALKGMKEDVLRVISLDFPEDICEVGSVYLRTNSKKIRTIALSTALDHLKNGVWEIIPEPKKV